MRRFGIGMVALAIAAPAAAQVSQNVSLLAHQNLYGPGGQSYASLMETACDLILSTDLGFTSAEVTDPILNQAYDLSVRIHNLRESQLRRAAQA